jgi:hypothetical protein
MSAGAIPERGVAVGPIPPLQFNDSAYGPN